MFDYDVFSLDSYDYFLPSDLIAQSPSDIRDHSRLLVVNREDNSIKEENYFYNIINYLKKGDVVVRNNTKVIPARLYGTKEETGAKVEVLLLHENSKNTWECLTGNAKVIKVGTRINFSKKLYGICKEVLNEGIRIIEFFYEGVFLEILNEIASIPLPPYIKKYIGDKSRYQTTYASISGSSAAPTAGFHFTSDLFKKMKEKGVEIVDITLHIGLGTFKPVKEKDIRNHDMHFEYYQVSSEAAKIINLAKKENRRIISIGTTSTRTLESVYSKFGTIKEDSDKTNLFIYPGFKFNVVDTLVTNFHLPKSTLLMLVSAFASRDLILKAYNYAVKNKFRFFSFGDAMLIL